MSWDPSLLRKYNITSHFRLLNQVRSELREQPIQRPLSGTRPEPSSRRGGASRSAEAGGRRRSSSGRAASAPPAPVSQAPSPESSFDPIVLVPVITDAFEAHS
ncbi:MAG: hypothetical protein ACKOCA_06625 [Vulcanococcus sp.]|nr:hypothetical protein [Cyanobacteria bacterium M_DeepCast_200m_mx_001]